MEKDIQVVTTALLAGLMGVWQKQKVVHVEGNYLVHKRANGCSIFETVCAAVYAMNCWCMVLEQYNGIDTWLVIVPGVETLVEKIQIRFKSGQNSLVLRPWV